MTQDNFKKLTIIRNKIDAVDKELLGLLAQRQKLVAQVLPIKNEEGWPARIEERITAVIDGVAQQAEHSGVDPDLARTVWTAMIEWFVRHEEQVLGRTPD